MRKGLGPYSRAAKPSLGCPSIVLMERLSLQLPEQRPSSQSMASGVRKAGVWGGECEGLRLGGGQGQAAGAERLCTQHSDGPSCLLSANTPVLSRGFHAGHLHLPVKSAKVLG